MHGDEPTATAALFDVFEYLRRHRDEPIVRRILSQLTLHVVPMLNPDGAERFQRRNAQSIDVNRDALRLQTPEGRALKQLRDRAKSAGWIQSAQPGLAHVGRRSAEARLDIAVVGRL
jgi:murein tripeptide amidase MpaA